MPNPRLASRYAKALLDLSVEKGQLEQVYNDVQWLQEVCKSSRDFVNLLRSPIVKADKKKSILDAVTATGNISEVTKAFNTLLVNKAREANLPEILTEFIHQYKTHKNIHTATLTTAVPVSAELKNAIVQKVKSSSGYDNVELVEKVDPALIGGFVLEMGDQMVDASIAYDLREVSKQFKNNDFIYKVR